MTSLADRRCVPCLGGTPPLTQSEIRPLLKQIEGWQVEDRKKLLKSYRFENFAQAVDFVNAITGVAEREGHHPDLYVRWGEVRVYLWTHKIDGLTESDFVMAAKIDRQYGSAGRRSAARRRTPAARGRAARTSVAAPRARARRRA
jgi:4a-hydroxytetrahydrobiopterin dehydratase